MHFAKHLGQSHGTGRTWGPPTREIPAPSLTEYLRLYPSINDDSKPLGIPRHGGCDFRARTTTDKTQNTPTAPTPPHARRDCTEAKLTASQ